MKIILAALAMLLDSQIGLSHKTCPDLQDDEIVDIQLLYDNSTFEQLQYVAMPKKNSIFYTDKHTVCHTVRLGDDRSLIRRFTVTDDVAVLYKSEVHIPSIRFTPNGSNLFEFIYQPVEHQKGYHVTGTFAAACTNNHNWIVMYGCCEFNGEIEEVVWILSKIYPKEMDEKIAAEMGHSFEEEVDVRRRVNVRDAHECMRSRRPQLLALGPITKSGVDEEFCACIEVQPYWRDCGMQEPMTYVLCVLGTLGVGLVIVLGFIIYRTR